MYFNEADRIPLDSSPHPLTAKLIEAAREGRRVQISYAKSGPIERRWIRPKSVFSMAPGSVKSTKADEVWVAAYCEKREDERTFAMRRIVGVSDECPEVGPVRKAREAPPGRVPCAIVETEVEGDSGPVEGVVAICGRCGHETESFGTGEGSVLRCLALLREECPNGETNFYVDEDE